jgi:hypothetical protein
MDGSINKRQLYWSRKQALYNERTSFFSHWQELSQFLLPRSGRFIEVGDRNKGDKRYNNIYDNTATRALRVLAAGLMSGMTSPARPWFRLGTRDKSLMESGPVKTWLDDTTEIMRDIFNVSNTYRALHSVYEEIGAFATGCTLIDSDFDAVIHHHPLTIGEYALAANAKGQVDTMVRSYEMTVAQIVKQFVEPSGNGKSGSVDWSIVSPAIKTMYDTGRSLDEWIPVVHIIEPRTDRDVTKRDSKNMAFASCIFEAGSNLENKFLRESGYKRFPVLAPRWDAKSSDVYGTSCPGMEALGDIKQLQHGQLRKAQAIDYMVKPPIQVPASMKEREVDSLPGGVSFVDMAGAGSKITSAWDVKIELTGQLEDIRDVRERIKQTFYADLFLMIAQDERSGVTAREVAERHEEKLLMLGPVLERLHNELLKQKIDITFDKMIEAGIVPPPPPEMQGQELQVEFVSMLAQAQKAIGTQAVDRFVGSMGAIAQFKPGVLDKFDEDRWADKYADMLGVDPDLIIANDKVAIVRQQRAENQAKQQKLAAAEQMASTAKTASQADTSGQNALTDVMQGLTGYTSGG